jgi:choline dehydrogenase-like flavoprotein
MFIDGRTLSDNQVLDADLCIVGTGAAGLSLLHGLAGRGLRIVLLESGGQAFEAASDTLNAGTSDLPDYPFQTSRARAFGGPFTSRRTPFLVCPRHCQHPHKTDPLAAGGLPRSRFFSATRSIWVRNFDTWYRTAPMFDASFTRPQLNLRRRKMANPSNCSGWPFRAESRHLSWHGFSFWPRAGSKIQDCC